MPKLIFKVAIPVILVGIFVTISLFSMVVDYESLGAGFYIVIVLLVVFVFFFGLAIGQKISNPLKEILNKATELSKGNLSSRVYLETKDEFSELAKTFNKIAEDLQTTHDEAVNAEKSIGIKVQARTQELQETINALEQKVRNRTAELERLMKETKK